MHQRNVTQQQKPREKMTTTTLPTVLLTSSAATVTEEGNITLTAASLDGSRLTSVELWRDGVSVASMAYSVPYVFTIPFTYADNGIHTFSAIAIDSNGNRGNTNSINLAVNIPAHDTFADVPQDQALAGTAWDTADRAWLPKTVLTGDGTGMAKISPAPQYGVCANYLALDGDAGQGVLFTTNAARSSAGNLISIAIDCIGSTPSSGVINGIEALLNGANTLYLKENVTGKLVAVAYNLDAGKDYWLDLCRVSDTMYRSRLSESVSGARGNVIAAAELVISTAHAAANKLVQLRTSAANCGIIRIKRVEALPSSFSIPVTAATTTTSTSSTTTTAAPAPTFLFLANDAAIAGPTGIVVQYGPHGAPVTLDAVELLYSGMAVGFAGNTQSRWRMRPITVGGIQYVPYVGLDSNGRVDVWIGGMFGAANTWTAINRERAALDLRISRNGTAFNMYTEGDTYGYTHQRGAWIRYESEPLPWNLTHDFIVGKQQSGAFVMHDTRNMIASNENVNLVDEKPSYKPFKLFSDSVAGNGLPYYDPRYHIGTQYRSTPAGGERLDIGPVHEWFARLISEVGTNNNAAWLTTAKATTLRYVAEAAAQTPLVSGMLDPATGRLIDPGATPISCHRNPSAWGPCVGVPQPGELGYNKNDDAEMLADSNWDIAHRPNCGVSYHAHQLSNDTWHLFLAQASAIACITYGTGGWRGTDGKINRIVVEEERGFWWGLQSLIEAWRATPDGDMPKPFLPKSYFATVIDNTLQWIRDSLMTDNAAYSSPAWQAAKFWCILAPFTMDPYPSEVFSSPFMSDYGNWVCCKMLMCGYTKGRDVAEWRFENARLRAQAGGSLYGSDQDLRNKGYLAQWIGSTSALPYADLASYKLAHPRHSDSVIDGNLSIMQWASGRDMYLCWGALNFMARIKAQGLATINWAPKAEALALVARHPGPYTGPTGVYAGWWAYGKQFVKPLE